MTFDITKRLNGWLDHLATPRAPKPVTHDDIHAAFFVAPLDTNQIEPAVNATVTAPEPTTMILITTVEHAVATVAHDVVIGAKAVKNALSKAAGVVAADAPTIEALTALVDPRAAAIERIGAALIGQIEPQLEKAAGDVANDATAPTVALTQELYAELKGLYASLASEIATAKTQVSSKPAVTVINT